ncbi:AraC family transcriptional regulator [Nocardioides sp. CN2-186]|uniref:AraC family transcriptional regulator n=1 Tax=Nocardioides tweenelious TaxID=3156607 RepID=UPI0032B3E81B
MMLIRGTSLTGFRELVDELGGDPDRLLRDVGISARSIGDYGEFIPYVPLLDVLELAAQTTMTPDFGRRLATRQGIEVLGSVGAAARSAPTVKAALATVERYLRAYTSATATRLTTHPGTGLTDFEFIRTAKDQLAAPYPQGIELTLGFGVQVFQLLVDKDWRPAQVHVPHSPLTEPGDYQRYFEAPVEFRARRCGYSLRSDDLDRPLSSDAATHDTLVSYLQAVAPFTPQGVVPMVNDLVRRLLPSGNVDLATVADQLGMHPRTLQRRLEDEGVTFAELVQDVRRRTAENYLRDTDMPLRHLASELGYLEQSAFSRASRRWFGMSPLAYRRELQLR